GWSRRLVWHTAIACVAIGVFAFWQEQFSYLSAFGRGDFGRASAVLDQLGWVGKDSATARLAVGSQLLQRGDVDGARREFERSVALRETPDGYTMLGRIEESKQDARGALAAYQRALAVDPNRRDVLVRAGQLLLALGGDAEGARCSTGLPPWSLRSRLHAVNPHLPARSSGSSTRTRP